MFQVHYVKNGYYKKWKDFEYDNYQKEYERKDEKYISRYLYICPKHSKKWKITIVLAFGNGWVGVGHSIIRAIWCYLFPMFGMVYTHFHHKASDSTRIDFILFIYCNKKRYIHIQFCFILFNINRIVSNNYIVLPSSLLKCSGKIH